MVYIQLIFRGNPEQLSDLQDELVNLPVDGSYLEDDQLLSSIPLEAWNDDLEIRCRLLANKYAVTFTFSKVKPQDWNAIWESSFEPYEIGTYCRIRASFHAPSDKFEHEIVIDPKMAFGTGHHETTSQVIALMQGLVLQDRMVMDFGAGTGILGILAVLNNAQQVWCIENDGTACENLRENVVRNKTANRTIVVQNSAPVPLPHDIDVLLMNITRNAIVELLPSMVSCLSARADVILSGFLKADRNRILEMTRILGLEEVKTLEQNQWLAMHLNLQ